MVDFVSLQISSTLSQYGSERRFSRGLLISELKGKLELITGTITGYMELELYDDKTLIAPLQDDKMLGYYSPKDNWRIHVIDKNPNSMKGEFDDVSKVEKFNLSEQEYDKKKDSVRNFMKQNKMGKYSDAAQQSLEKDSENEALEEERGRSFTIGNRCEVTFAKQSKRRGVVMFTGDVDFKPGFWVGIKYDEPLGKNDGSVQGKRYFTCSPRYGGFVRPSLVEVGDFPEEDLGFDDDDEM